MTVTFAYRLATELTQGGSILSSSHSAARRLIRLLVVVVLVGLGCNTTRYFSLPGKTQEYRLFGHHFLKVLLTNSVYDEEGQTYRLYISQEYRTQPANGFEIDSVGTIAIDSLCLELTCLKTTLCPKVQYTRMPEGPPVQDGLVIGPAYGWGIVRIPHECDSVTLTFAAVLHDRITAEETRRQPVKMVLSKRTAKISSAR